MSLKSCLDYDYEETGFGPQSVNLNEIRLRSMLHTMQLHIRDLEHEVLVLKRAVNKLEARR